jgi:hypothetical protein
MIKQVVVKFDYRSVVCLLQYFKHFEMVSTITRFLCATKCYLHNFNLAQYKNEQVYFKGHSNQEYIHFPDVLFTICV